MRIAPDEALVLWHEAPLWLLGQLATERKRRVSGDKVFYNRNIHLEPTNRCVFNCRFCSYRRPKESPEAWDYTMEEIEELARQLESFGVSFTDVAENCPRQKRTLHACQKVMEYAKGDSGLLEEFLRTKRLPAVRLSRECQCRKKDTGAAPEISGGTAFDLYKRI